MDSGFVFGDAPCIDKGLHVGVIVSELQQLAIA